MIDVRKIAFSYGNVPVLKDISLRLEKGRIYGLLGENGVGKTTLLTLLAGLKKVRSGSIDTDGYNPWDRKPSFLAGQFYLSDELRPFSMRADHWSAENGKFWPLYDHDVFMRVIGEFETDPRKKMREMSFGQLKKTYIAFALAVKARYIFMDEPTNGLDIPSKCQFRSALMRYTSEDTTVVISTHQVRDLENIIDPIIILDRQDVLLNASLSEISEKLFFDYGTILNSDALYSEQMPGGFVQVRENTEGIESKVNIEALFNAAHKNKAKIKSIFSGQEVRA